MADFIIGRTKCDDIIIFLGLYILTNIHSVHKMITGNSNISKTAYNTLINQLFTVLLVITQHRS